MDKHVPAESAGPPDTGPKLSPSMQLFIEMKDSGHWSDSELSQAHNAELRRMIEERYPLTFQQHWSSMQKYLDDALMYLADTLVTYVVVLAEAHPEVTVQGGYQGEYGRIEGGLESLKLQTQYDMIIALEERAQREETEDNG